jgi:hypothetical protein
MTINFKKHCRIEYGQYVQTHEQHDNSMTTRTVGAIAMRPTGNEQGSYYFYSLATCRRLHQTRWTELPMPAEVTDRVHALARRARAYRGLTFTDSDGADLDVLDNTFEPIGTDETENSLADARQDQADVDATMPQLINRGAASDDSDSDSDSDNESDNDPDDEDLPKSSRPNSTAK